MSRRNETVADQLRLKKIARLFLEIDSSPDRYMPALNNAELRIQGTSFGLSLTVVFRSMKDRRISCGRIPDNILKELGDKFLYADFVCVKHFGAEYIREVSGKDLSRIIRELSLKFTVLVEQRKLT